MNPRSLHAVSAFVLLLAAPAFAAKGYVEPPTSCPKDGYASVAWHDPNAFGGCDQSIWDHLEFAGVTKAVWDRSNHCALVLKDETVQARACELVYFAREASDPAFTRWESQATYRGTTLADLRSTLVRKIDYLQMRIKEAHDYLPADCATMLELNTHLSDLYQAWKTMPQVGTDATLKRLQADDQGRMRQLESIRRAADAARGPAEEGQILDRYFDASAARSRAGATAPVPVQQPAYRVNAQGRRIVLSAPSHPSLTGVKIPPDPQNIYQIPGPAYDARADARKLIAWAKSPELADRIVCTARGCGRDPCFGAIPMGAQSQCLSKDFTQLEAEQEVALALGHDPTPLEMRDLEHYLMSYLSARGYNMTGSDNLPRWPITTSATMAVAVPIYTTAKWIDQKFNTNLLESLPGGFPTHTRNTSPATWGEVQQAETGLFDGWADGLSAKRPKK